MRLDRRFSGLLKALGAIGCCLAISPAASLAYEGYKEVPTSQFGEPCTGAPCGGGQFSNPTELAVNDETGRVYVIDKADNRVEYFSAAGTYEGQFNGSGTLSGEGKAAGSGGLPGEISTGQFSEPDSISVDNSSDAAHGDVYVADAGNGVVDVFGLEGEYLSQLTGAPTGPKGEFETFPHIEAQSNEGQSLKGVAVDLTGNVIVAFDKDQGSFHSNSLGIYEFSNNGEYLHGFINSIFIEAGLTVDTQDTIYLTESPFEAGGGRLAKFNLQGGQLNPESSETHATDVALNTGTNNLFLDKENNIVENPPFGEPFFKPVRTFGNGYLEGSHGLAINSATGTVYASEEQAGKVEVFQRVLFPNPTAVTGATQSVTRTAAQVTGSVNPEELPTSYYYQYGPDIPGAPVGYGATTGALPVTAGVGSTPAAGELGDLVPNTTYHYRLVAVNEAGTGYGEDHMFTTPANVPPGVATGGASGVTSTAATISGTVEPGGIPTTYEFQIGTDTSYGATVFRSAGQSSVPQAETQLVASLQPATTYHYRLCASNEANAEAPVCGADASFTTAGVPGGPAQPGTPPLLATPAIAFPRDAVAAASPKALTSAQKLKSALRACGKKPKKQRAGCERAAHKRFAPAKAKAKAKRGKG